MKKHLYLIAFALTSCTASRTITYKEAKMINGKPVAISEAKKTKVTPGQIRYFHKSTKFKQGETFNIIVKN